MEFDITNIDKTLLVQALFSHSAPIGLGIAESIVRNQRGENVDGLTDKDCALLLYDFNNSYSRSENFHIADYHMGKPMKLNFYRNRNGRVVVDSARYDSRNGRFRFLEAMLNTFSMDEILITKKGYRHYVMAELPERLIRPKEQDQKFKNLIKSTIQKESKFGKYWTFDESKVSYIPPFMQL